MVSKLTCLITLAVIACVAGLDGDSPQLPNNLWLIGTADGKSYFTESASTYTWAEAKAYCAQTGMHLATITTAAQSTLLNGHYDATNYNGNYWIGGRDARQLRQFSWDNTNGEISSSFTTLTSAVTHLTCLYINKSASSRTVRSENCASRLKVICET